MVYPEATLIISPREPAPYGILVFSSLNLSINAHPWISLGGINYENLITDNTQHVRLELTVEMLSPLDDEAYSEEQIVGIQIPYHVERLNIGTREGEDYTSDSVTIEVVDQERREDVSLIYCTFTPINGVNNYEFIFQFDWIDAVIQRTVSTFSISLPIQTSDANVFENYFSNLNEVVYPILNIDQDAELRIEVSLPDDCEIWDTSQVQARGEHIRYEPVNGDFHIEQKFSFAFKLGQMIPSFGTVSSSQVLRINFESSEELNKHNNTLYYAGMFMGIGISNIISGLYGALRSIQEIQIYRKK